MAAGRGNVENPVWSPDSKKLAFSATMLIFGIFVLKAAIDYVLQNPVRAGLCDDARDWPWTGAV